MSFLFGGNMTREERKKRREDIVEYRKAGHYIRECCEHFGVNESYVHMACRGISYPWVKDTETMRQAALEQGKNRIPSVENAIRIINERAPQFEYAGNYTGVDGYVDLKCRTCGTIARKSFVGVRHGNTCCQECKKRYTEQNAIEKAKQNAIEKIEQQKEKVKRQNRKTIQLSLSVCEFCGSVFVPKRKGLKYCSDDCARKRWDNKDKRINIIKRITVDSDITLPKLYNRDNGVCAICGKKCDWNDCEVRSDGTFIAFNYYPSIDHKIPISKGGLHSWNNVQLAHRICNSRKYNKVYTLPMRQ